MAEASHRSLSLKKTMTPRTSSQKCKEIYKTLHMYSHVIVLVCQQTVSRYTCIRQTRKLHKTSDSYYSIIVSNSGRNSDHVICDPCYNESWLHMAKSLKYIYNSIFTKNSNIKYFSKGSLSLFIQCITLPWKCSEVFLNQDGKLSGSASQHQMGVQPRRLCQKQLLVQTYP